MVQGEGTNGKSPRDGGGGGGGWGSERAGPAHTVGLSLVKIWLCCD